MNRKKEIAKFFCGVEAFHAVLHGYLWLSGTTLTAFGITATPMLSLVGTIVNAIISISLGAYGWLISAPKYINYAVPRRPDPCPCGNPLPAIRVQGRAAEVLTFSTERGERISIPPLAFEVDHIPGIERVQVVQTSATSLRVRLLVAPGAEPNRVWQAAHTEITRMLTQHQLFHVTVERGEESPEQSPGGKYRAVIPLH